LALVDIMTPILLYFDGYISVSKVNVLTRCLERYYVPQCTAVKSIYERSGEH
ncbi:Hypothetical predicted protein, partial [Podarcis lilfordi]